MMSTDFRHVLSASPGRESVTMTPFKLEVGRFISSVWARLEFQAGEIGQYALTPRRAYVGLLGRDRPVPLGRFEIMGSGDLSAFGGNSVALELQGAWSMDPTEIFGLLGAMNGQEVRISITATFDATMTTPPKLYGSRATIEHSWQHRFARSDWAAHLDAVDGTVVTDGLVFAIAPSSAFYPAAQALNKARRQLIRGDRDDALVRARDAITALEGLNSGARKNTLSTAPMKADPVDLRARRLLEAARYLSHVGAHGGEIAGELSHELVNGVINVIASVLSHAMAARADANPDFWK